MEKKKTVKKRTKKTSTSKSKKSITKKTQKKKGFTLIELLAVIIILGILMIIAIPSVTSYISDSRKNAYVDTAKEIVGGTRNLVNDGKLGMYDTNTTYYIPVDYIKTENASKSPYGEFTEAYVGVIYDGTGYKYYWISTDDAGQGVKEITLIDSLDTNDIESDLNENDIKSTVKKTGIGDRNNIKILNNDGTWDDYNVENNVTELGDKLICKRATVLHTETCNQTSSSYYCGGDGYTSGNKGTTITYGNQSVTNGKLTVGDAFDCDVNGDGVFDQTSERFYYISDYYDTSSKKFISEVAVLIYYSNTSQGVPSTSNVPYDTVNENWHGPRRMIQELPTKTQWKNIELYREERKILASSGLYRTPGGDLPSAFSYSKYAARLLTAQELSFFCLTNEEHSLSKCNFILERTKYSLNSTPTFGGRLETPNGISNTVLFVNCNTRDLDGIRPNNSSTSGARPVIELLKTQIMY